MNRELLVRCLIGVIPDHEKVAKIGSILKGVGVAAGIGGAGAIATGAALRRRAAKKREARRFLRTGAYRPGQGMIVPPHMY